MGIPMATVGVKRLQNKRISSETGALFLKMIYPDSLMMPWIRCNAILLQEQGNF